MHQKFHYDDNDDDDDDDNDDWFSSFLNAPWPIIQQHKWLYPLYAPSGSILHTQSANFMPNIQQTDTKCNWPRCKGRLTSAQRPLDQRNHSALQTRTVNNNTLYTSQLY